MVTHIKRRDRGRKKEVENPRRTRQERNKYRTRTANGYPHKGSGQRQERGKWKTQKEPGRKGTN